MLRDFNDVSLTPNTHFLRLAEAAAALSHIEPLCCSLAGEREDDGARANEKRTTPPDLSKARREYCRCQRAAGDSLPQVVTRVHLKVKGSQVREHEAGRGEAKDCLTSGSAADDNGAATRHQKEQMRRVRRNLYLRESGWESCEMP